MATTRQIPSIVGLNGYSKSGKDLVTTILVEEFGYQRFAMGDHLKDFIAAVFPEVRSKVDEVGWDVAKEEMEVRRALQEVGDALRAHLHPDILLISALGDAGSFALEHPVVISDVRLPNEADWVVGRGGILLRVERPGVGPTNDHRTETALDRYDGFFGVIHNDSTPESLRARVFDAINEWSDAQEVSRVS